MLTPQLLTYDSMLRTAGFRMPKNRRTLWLRGLIEKY